jgi:negative regulator of replication initiation
MATKSPRDDVQKILDEINAETARMLERTKRDQVAARNQVAAEDVPLLERLQEVARMPEKVSMRQFHELIKNDLEYEESKGVERFLALWETYLQYHAESSQAPHHWSGVGPVSYNAPASRGSVVDAVFAKLGA